MPLSAPAARQHYHTRKITCEGFARDDGLWDIEAHMTDVKGYDFQNSWRGRIDPGVPVHEMWLRLTLSDDYTIVDIEAVTDNSPFEICAAITPNFKKLVGLKIGPGWRRKMRELVGGTHGCTHIVELFGPLATVAYQTIGPGKARRDKQPENAPTNRMPGEAPESRPQVLNTCHAWASDSPVVKEFLPEFYTGRKD
jgi:hypothetical protein